MMEQRPADLTVNGAGAVAVCESTLLVKHGDEFRVARRWNRRTNPHVPGG